MWLLNAMWHEIVRQWLINLKKGIKTFSNIRVLAILLRTIRLSNSVTVKSLDGSLHVSLSSLISFNFLFWNSGFTCTLQRSSYLSIWFMHVNNSFGHEQFPYQLVLFVYRPQLKLMLGLKCSVISSFVLFLKQEVVKNWFFFFFQDFTGNSFAFF